MWRPRWSTKFVRLLPTCSCTHCKGLSYESTMNANTWKVQCNFGVLLQQLSQPINLLNNAHSVDVCVMCIFMFWGMWRWSVCDITHVALYGHANHNAWWTALSRKELLVKFCTPSWAYPRRRKWNRLILKIETSCTVSMWIFCIVHVLYLCLNKHTAANILL